MSWVVSSEKGGDTSYLRDNFELEYNVTDKLCVAVGDSRSAIDENFVLNTMLVGQTGKKYGN
ncbi:FAD-binding protein [Aestuariirhabdus sp. LZHN29]|uniref:FAD-binding protein n=1 Tax=Aestuariirhabdus sp. LZHN29 TaxID=3417462 RepID=UPI003CE6CC28